MTLLFPMVTVLCPLRLSLEDGVHLQGRGCESAEDSGKLFRKVHELQSTNLSFGHADQILDAVGSTEQPAFLACLSFHPGQSGQQVLSPLDVPKDDQATAPKN